MVADAFGRVLNDGKAIERLVEPGGEGSGRAGGHRERGEAGAEPPEFGADGGAEGGVPGAGEPDGRDGAAVQRRPGEGGVPTGKDLARPEQRCYNGHNEKFFEGGPGKWPSKERNPRRF